jgi:hypothetical protein
MAGDLLLVCPSLHLPISLTSVRFLFSKKRKMERSTGRQRDRERQRERRLADTRTDRLIVKKTDLTDFCFAWNNTHCNFPMGVCVLVNHHTANSVTHDYKDSDDYMDSAQRRDVAWDSSPLEMVCVLVRWRHDVNIPAPSLFLTPFSLCQGIHERHRSGRGIFHRLWRRLALRPPSPRRYGDPSTQHIHTHSHAFTQTRHPLTLSQLHSEGSATLNLSCECMCFRKHFLCILSLTPSLTAAAANM